MNTGSRELNKIAEARHRALGFLAAGQSADGGWGYAPAKQSFAEPTAYALLALAARANDAGRAERERKALAWLAAGSRSGPIVVGERGRDVLPTSVDVWGTIISFFALSRLNAGAELMPRYLNFLLGVRGNRVDEGTSAMLKLDGNLLAWGWALGTASWVEPTAYALLALKAYGESAHERVKAGERFLLDRACYEGGWNYGNKEVLAVALEPMPTVTAYALMALQDFDRTHAIIEKSLNYLESELAVRQSTLALALGALCFDVYARPADKLIAGLVARQEADGSWRENYHLTALAALALEAVSGGRNVFKL